MPGSSPGMTTGCAAAAPLDLLTMALSSKVRNDIFPSFKDIGEIMIGMLVFPDFQLLDAAGPISVFEIAGRFADQPLPIRVMAVTPGPVRSSSGVEMLARGLRASAANPPLVGGRRGGGG